MKRAAEAGEILHLGRRHDNVLRGQVIRDLLRADGLDPRGIRVRGARITGELDLSNLETSTSLELDDSVIEAPMWFCDATLHSLTFDGSTMPGLHAEGMRVRYFGLREARCTGVLDLDNAHIDGTLFLHGTSVRMFYGNGLRVRGHVQADGMFVDGTLWLDSCDIGGDLQLEGAVIDNASGEALRANNAKIGGVVQLSLSFIRAGEGAAMQLIDATAGGLRMRGAVLRGAADTSLCLDGAEFRQEVRLSEGFDALSESAQAGTVRMVDTKIGAGLIVSGRVRNGDGQALLVHKTSIGASVTFSDAEVEAHSPMPAVEFSDTRVSGELVFRPGKLINHGAGYELALLGTKVGDALALDVPELLEAEIFTASVDGLTYPDPPDDTGAWLTMLRDHSFNYHAQPYQQLAAVHRAAGHEHTARKVLIAQQRDLRRRGDPGNKLWHWFLGVTLGYGYKPSRAVAGLLITFVLALCLVWTTNAYNGLTPAKDRGPDACSPVNRISLAADLAIPLVKLGGTPRCELANGPAGQWATGAGWVIQILGWSFATLSVAGFTGLVRKS
ncbi:hypothetical protein UK23_11530 [Lentzea aerocolonigenes]|uniref:Membrane-associated oxidoreductase n=1 Tax=Lentzea aerocolonigenes TaxID=68170 RepID=A0A0F0H752_LENAE|nr:hypothetical protein [Lentzea aerocolonigenes]KJK50147.1 hypothetical protein UK23_11530 [Lentzea aerocolonigenes]